MKNFKRNIKGITLIALVITIIVLLILAGVSIGMLTGENGILSQAQKAKEQTENATVEEQKQIAMAEAAMNLDGKEYKSTYNNKEVTVPIPAGFAPTRIAGESTVDEGLVIIDSNGNEFVWIPCEYDKESAEKNENLGAIIYNVSDETKDNRDNDWKEIQWMYNGGIWYDEQPHTIGKKSIQKYHGFFVARYEAGVPESANFYVDEEMTGDKLNYKNNEYKNNTTNSSDKQDVRTLATVSKKGNQSWNYISQINAKIVAGNMINNSDVQSYLIDSHAWNTICRLIENKYKKEDKTKVTDSTNWGNYYNNKATKYENLKGLWAVHTTTSEASTYSTGLIPIGTAPKEDDTNTNRLELATGICEDFKAYNIYDLAGNMWEWTTEVGEGVKENNKDGTVQCKEEAYPSSVNDPKAVRRGGCFTDVGDGGPVIGALGSWTNRSMRTWYRVSCSSLSKVVKQIATKQQWNENLRM